MKKTILLLLVLGLVVGTAFATPTFKFSGNLGANYKFFFDGSKETSGADDDYDYRNGAAAADLTLKVTDDFYTVSLRNSLGNQAAFNSKDWYATADLKVSEILASAGIDSPVDLTAHIGNINYYVSSVYTDPTGDDGDYYGLGSGATRANLPVGLTVGYGDIIKVKGVYDILAEAGGVQVVTTPVEGIDASVGFVTKAWVYDDTYGWPNYAAVATDDSAVLASATVDVAALAGLDFDFALSGLGYFYFGDYTDAATVSPNIYRAAITGGKDAVSAYVEYTNELEKNNIYFGAGYQATDALKVSAGVDLEDLSDLAIGAYAKAAYTIAGFTPYVQYGFGNNAETSADHYIKTGVTFSI